MENDPHEGKRVLYDAFKAYNEIPKALGVPIPLGRSTLYRHGGCMWQCVVCLIE